MSMDIDIIAALIRQGSTVTVHNVRLVAVQPGGDDYERLTIEHAGCTHELLGGGKWNEQFSRRAVDRIGYVSPVSSLSGLAAGACYFREYLDQSLRRVPELDFFPDYVESSAMALPVIGWRCDAKPGGFRAPLGIIPGKDGLFVPDETVAVTLRVPPEFLRECRRVQMSPEDLLRSFVGDLAGIQNYVACPRADRYGSGGSDERDYAEAWFQRSHGMNIVDLNELESREFEDQERKDLRDDLALLLDDFEDAGGKPEELIAAVEKLVHKKKLEGH